MTLFLLDLPQRRIPLEDLCFSFTSSQHTFTREILSEYHDTIQCFYEENRKHAPPRYDPNNNPILTLDSFSSIPQRKFSLGTAEFRDYFALRNLLYQNRDDKRLFQQFVPLSMIAVLETADHYLVIGHRGGNHLSHRYLFPAGFLPYHGDITPAYFRNICREEFLEEIGINFDDVSYIGLTGDTRDSFLDVCIFYGKTSLSRTQIQQAWETNGAKDEHSHLIYIPSFSESVLEFLSGNFTGEVNPFMNIHFKKGICISGPQEILGKSYQQIENGVGASAAYLSLYNSLTDIQSQLRHLVSLNILEGVVTKNINGGLSHLVSQEIPGYA